MADMFSGAIAFVGNLSNWDTSQVTTMAYMFYRASAFVGGDLSNWDVSQVTNMVSMFYYASAFVGDISLSTWDGKCGSVY